MDKFEGRLSDNSVWMTLTPAPLTQTLPFYISEAGHFDVYSDYMVKRDFHDSFLLLYTCSGEGCVKTGDITIQLPEKHAVIIDCHNPHEYFSQSGQWNFLWMHFHGIGVESLFEIIYSGNSVHGINMESADMFKSNITQIIDSMTRNDIKSCLDISAGVHSLLNSIHSASIEGETTNRKKEFAEDIRIVLDYISENYSQPITVDDMVNIIHLSKYHFIRRFNRIMGVTPYNYLTNYRITMAKTMLRQTTKQVSEIAEECGFLDTSNFITHFKKRTGQKPLQYRRDFT